MTGRRPLVERRPTAMQQKPDYYYQQSAVIPYRRDHAGLEILMITSRKNRRWVIPKGVVEPDLSAPDSAAKEAMEEAGLAGEVSPTAIGTYQYPKWGGTCTVEVFAMRVDRVLDEWLEDYRERDWLSLDAAAERVTEDGLRRIMRSLPGFLEKED